MSQLPSSTTRPPYLKPTGLAARRAEAQSVALAKGDPIVISPQEMEHRIGIVFDDSGSMSSRIAQAHLAVEEFLRSCEKDKTAVAVYPMNDKALQLSSNLPALAILVSKIQATGSTPLLATLKDMLRKENLTRAIVFSDGQPDNESGVDTIKDFGKPVDTIYIGRENPYAEDFMRKLAETTGGIYLKFDPNSPNFRNSFKYLSPGLRYMLTDKAFVESIQK